MKTTTTQPGQIEAGQRVRLTQEKIEELTSANQLDEYPSVEGLVNRVFSIYSPVVFSINFGDQKRILRRNEVEPIN